MTNAYFRNFNHLLTTQPQDIVELFVSDLHLSEDEPALVQAFLAFLQDTIALPNLKKLYILGDWFDAWIGDDAYLTLDTNQKAVHWITPIISQLNKLHQNGCQIFVMQGNRDFLLKQPFCDAFFATLINEPTLISIGHQKTRLEHGDALCTDDKRYQSFRKFARNRFVQWWLLKKPLQKRLQIAEKLRKQSKKENAHKSNEIMDVNQKQVSKQMRNVDLLIHGHTHRPAIHKLSHNQTRYVLGDWRIKKPKSSYQTVEAVIGAVYTNHDSTPVFELCEYSHKTK
ncbi:UDP-2,3-diacylglucosamine diphosphatase [Psychrobacter sp. HD31]|uniref:UDP-2,3-diacylglucosamine diphosphatase n=1 Tax=Psychrobacter sp. HD31 TaxID=3112003 RepID=UPI003DA60A31